LKEFISGLKLALRKRIPVTCLLAGSMSDYHDIQLEFRGIIIGMLRENSLQIGNQRKEEIRKIPK